MPMEVKSFFDIFNIIVEKKKKPAPDIIDRHCNQWMLNMLMSSDKTMVSIANQMSQLKLSNAAYFDCLYYGIPKTKKFIKYNAKKEKKQQDVSYMMEYFKCNNQTAESYLSIIKEDELQKIRDFYEKRGFVK